MRKLIKNEYIKLGYVKLLFPFLLFTIVFIIQNIVNKQININLPLFLIPLISIIISMIFSGIFSNEITDGTFRLYLTKGISRKKVYFSKLLSLMIYSFVLSTYILLLYIIFLNDVTFKFILRYYMYTMPIYFVGTLTMLLSILIKNTPINLGICVSFMIFSGAISEFLFKNKILFIQYLFLPYLDFTIFLDKGSLKLVNKEFGTNLNIIYAVFILIAFCILFIILGYFIFNKKDIKS